MNKRKWIFTVSITLGLLSFASFALASAITNTIYLPAVYKGPTFTPTVTLTPTTEAKVTITHIEYDPSGPDIDSEYVSIKNYTSQSVNMTGWILMKNSGTYYTFPTFTLGAGKEVKVWDKSGKDTSTDLYWKLSSAIWDNVSGCARLYDKNDKLVDEFCYP